jgi:hypothetical protein
MKRIILSAAVVAVAMCGLANGADVDVTSEGSVLVKGQAYKQTLDGKTVAKQPSWNPLKEKCPLDPSKAVQLATAKLKATFPKATHLTLSSVSVEKVPAAKNKWHYFVNFFQNPDSMEGDYANVIVCLDGTVPKFQKEE